MTDGDLISLMPARNSSSSKLTLLSHLPVGVNDLDRGEGRRGSARAEGRPTAAGPTTAAAEPVEPAEPVAAGRKDCPLGAEDCPGDVSLRRLAVRGGGEAKGESSDVAETAAAVLRASRRALAVESARPRSSVTVFSCSRASWTRLRVPSSSPSCRCSFWTSWSLVDSLSRSSPCPLAHSRCS